VRRVAQSPAVSRRALETVLLTVGVLTNDLETHIEDLLAVIKYEDLNDVVLIGHSYGGMVATGVADRARDRIAQVIYLDAFVPRDRQALFDYCTRVAPGDPFRQFAKRARHEPGWRYYEIDASHSPHVTAPEALAALLQKIASERT
jgi:thioesterase domain-containing protein